MSDLEKIKKSGKAVGKGLVRVILPLHAIRKTGSLMLGEAKQHRNNINAIKDMATNIKNSFEKKDIKKMTFAQAVGTDHKVIEQHFNYFLKQKQMYLSLAVALIFMQLALLLILHPHHAPFVSLFSSICGILITIALTWSIALGPQIRLWQLQTRRLSVEEKGGFDSFKAENKDWILQVFNPFSKFVTEPTK